MRIAKVVALVVGLGFVGSMLGACSSSCCPNPCQSSCNTCESSCNPCQKNNCCGTCQSPCGVPSGGSYVQPMPVPAK